MGKPNNLMSTRTALGLVSGMAVLVIAGCGGGGGGGGSEAVGSAAQAKNCRPGIIAGFAGKFDDQPISVIASAGAEGVGGSGEGDSGGGGGGAAGVGAGGSLGQFANVDMSIEFASGETFGPVRVDAQKGMVTIVPCELQPPALIKLVGAVGSGARYYDEARGTEISFEGRELRSVITSFAKNAGITTFTEAMVQRAERVATTKSNVSPKNAWRDLSVINSAHDEVLKAINAQLPGVYRLDDLRRLPVILNAERAAAGSSALTDNQNGKYGAALSGLVSVGAANLGDVEAPALEINDQLVADLADGQFDLVDNGAPVAKAGGAAYTYDSFWSFQALHTTEAAQRSGEGSLATAIIPFDSTLVTAESGGQETVRLEVTHGSDGVLTWVESVVGCPVFSRVVQNVRQKRLLSAISQDGKTFYRTLPGPDRCTPVFETPFDVPNTSIASMDNLGGIVRATDGRFFVFAPNLDDGSPWWELVADGPRPIYAQAAFGFLWTVTDSGQLIQYTYPKDTGLLIEAENRRLRPTRGSGTLIPLPAPVVQIANSADNRETFALTSAGEVFWMELRDSTGFRNPEFAPEPISLGGGNICWISQGMIAVACDGSFHQVARAVTDLSVPPIEDYIGADGVRIFVPGTGSVFVEEAVLAQTPIWRASDQFAFAEGAQLPSEVQNPARLIGIDGSLRTLSGQVLQPGIQ